MNEMILQQRPDSKPSLISLIINFSFNYKHSLISLIQSGIKFHNFPFFIKVAVAHLQISKCQCSIGVMYDGILLHVLYH